MGRKTSVTYAPDSGNVQRSESWHYDTAGRTDTFTNRNGKVQTFTYDALNRTTGFSWEKGKGSVLTFDTVFLHFHRGGFRQPIWWQGR